MSTPVEATLSSIFKKLLENVPHDKRNDILNDLLELVLETSHIDTSMLSMEEIEETKRALLNLVFGRRLSLRQRELFFKLGIEEELLPEIELWERVISHLVTEKWPVFILLDEFLRFMEEFLREVGSGLVVESVDLQPVKKRSSKCYARSPVHIYSLTHCCHLQ